jgi:hypothetical protein
VNDSGEFTHKLDDGFSIRGGLGGENERTINDETETEACDNVRIFLRDSCLL